MANKKSFKWIIGGVLVGTLILVIVIGNTSSLFGSFSPVRNVASQEIEGDLYLNNIDYSNEYNRFAIEVCSDRMAPEMINNRTFEVQYTINGITDSIGGFEAPVVNQCKYVYSSPTLHYNAPPGITGVLVTAELLLEEEDADPTNDSITQIVNTY
ncbi:hypothetical protein HN748_02260 [Candidatus Peregrinibacteria bacterium]|jgi:hypothetical protein|nr:hypothetical protein [Candidatus Peregrinibacteria bacterium]MBT7483778.1 hypothetical protein [Candidatus Peregrinibacteria bacterium]MBT7703032.1 hypothetical protein [Candidatus Peregrinibacteria bacterium]